MNRIKPIIFKAGARYLPRELNAKDISEKRVALGIKMSGTVTQKPPAFEFDVLQRLNLNPLKEYKNVAMLSHFLNPIGDIESRLVTGLSKSNQKRMSKAVRRARSMGYLPTTHRLINIE